MSQPIINSPQDLKRGVDYIGVGCVFFCHDGNGKFLFNKRSNKCRDEVGRWDNGGGSLEFGETPEQGVIREVKEEYCADVLEMEFGGVKSIMRENDSMPTHWVQFVFLVRVDPSQVKIGDPEKMEAIGWFELDNLPQPLHSQALGLFESVKDLYVGQAYSSAEGVSSSV